MQLWVLVLSTAALIDTPECGGQGEHQRSAGGEAQVRAHLSGPRVGLRQHLDDDQASITPAGEAEQRRRQLRGAAAEEEDRDRANPVASAVSQAARNRTTTWGIE